MFTLPTSRPDLPLPSRLGGNYRPFHRGASECFGPEFNHTVSNSRSDIDPRPRFEILPLGKSEEEAAELSETLRLTVTCSPKHGPDTSVEVGARLRALGHAVTVHIAARMVRDHEHLDALLAGMADAGVDDVFVIGGDVAPPRGEFSSAVELVPAIAEHPRRPAMIGIAGYPEDHPLIDTDELEEALAQKSALASYITTQMCFDADVLRAWIERQRQRGITLPVFIGVPGKVARGRLLEMSMRIGVGPSLKFLRKQRGIWNLFGRSATNRLFKELLPSLDDSELNIAEFHFFTFNQLVDTWRWQQEKRPAEAGRGSYKGSVAVDAMSIVRRT